MYGGLRSEAFEQADVQVIASDPLTSFNHITLGAEDVQYDTSSY